MAKEMELTAKTYEQIKVTPAGAKLSGEMQLSQKTYGFYLTAFTAAMLALAEDATLITKAQSVKVVKATGSIWVAGDPVFWLEATSNYTNVDNGEGYLVGKVAEAASSPAVIGYVNFRDYYPTQRGMQIGNIQIPYKIVAADPLISIYSTSLTVGNIEPMIVDTVLTGVGATGGRARFRLSTEVALGGWANALKAITDFGTAGRVTGLASAFCAELIMPATAPPGGNYVALEAELRMPSGAGVGAGMAYIYCNVQDTDKATFQGAGYFAIIDNAGDASDGLFYSTNNGTTDAWLRFRINGTDYYAMMSLVATEA